MINTTQATINYRNHYPDMTLEEIGINVGLTKQRVSQILTKANVETRSLKKIPAPFPNCQTCGKPVSHLQQIDALTSHQKASVRRRLFCSTACQFPQGKTSTNCHYCNKELIFMTSVYNTRLRRSRFIHCSRACRDSSRRGTPMIVYKNI